MTLDQLLEATAQASLDDLSAVVALATSRAMDLSEGDEMGAVRDDFASAWSLWQRTCMERDRLIRGAS